MKRELIGGIIMKKFTSLLLVFVLTLSVLVGCSGPEDDQVTLNVYNWGDYIDEKYSRRL